MRHSFSPLTAITGLIALALLAGLALFGWSAVDHYHEHDAVCTVTNMDRGMDSSGNSHYRVYTKQCDTLADEDSLWFGKWNSSDLWGQIQVGRTYTFHVAGVRSGLLSSFANIISVKPAP